MMTTIDSSTNRIDQGLDVSESQKTDIESPEGDLFSQLAELQLKIGQLLSRWKDTCRQQNPVMVKNNFDMQKKAFETRQSENESRFDSAKTQAIGSFVGGISMAAFGVAGVKWHGLEAVGSGLNSLVSGGITNRLAAQDTLDADNYKNMADFQQSAAQEMAKRTDENDDDCRKASDKIQASNSMFADIHGDITNKLGKF